MYRVWAQGVVKQIETWLLVFPLHDYGKAPFAQDLLDEVIEQITGLFSGFS